MSKIDNRGSTTPIVFLAKRNRYTILDLARALGCTNKTIREYIKDPYKIKMRDIAILSGLFGIKAIELFHLLQTNSPSFNRKTEEKWYIRDIEKNSHKLLE